MAEHTRVSKNKPRTPEEQQKALEEFLMSQDTTLQPSNEDKKRKKRKSLLKSKIRHTSSKEKEIPKIPSHDPPTTSPRAISPRVSSPRKDVQKPPAIPPKPPIIPPKPSMPPKIIDFKYDTPLPKPPIVNRPLTVKPITNKNQPLSIEEQKLAAEKYLSSLSDDKQQKEPIVTKTSKNKPLSPEEQEKAFEAYVASLDKVTEAENRSSPKVSKTSKNQPLSIEEQKKLAEKYLSSLSDDKEQKEPIVTKTSKNKPLSPEEQEKAFELYAASLAKNTTPVVKSVSENTHLKVNKNRPSTREEQEAALNHFILRQAYEKKEAAKQKRKTKRLSVFLPKKSLKQKNQPQVKEENLGPLPMGSDLSHYLLSNFDATFNLIENIPSEHAPNLCTAILELFYHNNCDIKLIEYCLQKELDKSSIEETLFRGNTAGTYLFSTFCKVRGLKYLRGVMSDILERLRKRRDPIEVDPNRCRDEVAEENIGILRTFTEEFMERLFESIYALPKSIGKIFNILTEMVEKKFPNSVSKIQGGFFFLRFVNPMAINPQTYGLVDKKISASCRRSLILITKLIQNISNDVTTLKEQYLTPLADLADVFRERTREFLFKLGDYDKLIDQDPEYGSVNEIQNAQNKALRTIATVIAPNYKVIQELSREVPEKMEIMKDIIYKINNLEPIGCVKSEQEKNNNSNTSDDDTDFEFSRESFLFLREAFKQCEAELKETKIRLEEETMLRRSMQAVVLELADSIHAQIDQRVAIKMGLIEEKSKGDKGLDICDEILRLCEPKEGITNIEFLKKRAQKSFSTMQPTTEDISTITTSSDISQSEKEDESKEPDNDVGVPESDGKIITDSSDFEDTETTKSLETTEDNSMGIEDTESNNFTEETTEEGTEYYVENTTGVEYEGNNVLSTQTLNINNEELDSYEEDLLQDSETTTDDNNFENLIQGETSSPLKVEDEGYYKDDMEFLINDILPPEHADNPEELDNPYPEEILENTVDEYNDDLDYLLDEELGEYL